MKIVFTKKAWNEYISWENEDKRILNKLNTLIEDIVRNGNKGLGKPEPLIGDLTGFWSRRLTVKDRLVYTIEDDSVIIVKCRNH
jgi:toxin YoeB